MDIAYARRLIDEPAESSVWLRRRGLRDVAAGHHALEAIDQIGLSPDLLAALLAALEVELAATDDPDLALSGLGQFLSAVRSPLAFAALVERDPTALTHLLNILGASPLLGRWLVNDPEAFDFLRLTEGQPAAKQALVDEVGSELSSLEDVRSQAARLHQYQRREMLRVAYGQLVLGHSPELVEQQLAVVADALCHAAWQAATGEVQQRRGAPRLPHRRPCRISVLATGHYGTGRLDYAGPLSLLMVYEGEGRTEGTKGCSNREFFDLVARRFSMLIGAMQNETVGYELDLSARPIHDQSRWVVSQDEVLRFYDVVGDAAARQRLLQMRHVAGDESLSSELIRQLHALIFRRFPTETDLWESRMLAQQLRRQLKQLGVDRDQLANWRHLIRDIISSAQMVYGEQTLALRTLGVPEGLMQLAESGWLRMADAQLLRETWDWLNRMLHARQIGGQVGVADIELLRQRVARVAVRNLDGPRSNLERELSDQLGRARTSLQQLLTQTMGGAVEEDGGAELLLVSSGHPLEKESGLSGFGFRDKAVARMNLEQLAVEPIPFLSTRRCRHSLARIAHTLLTTIARTPEPDATLGNLARVSDSLGAKGVLWDLFQLNPASLQLYVDLCAVSPYLASILTTHPGMIDELMDSLVLQHLPSIGFLRRQLAELGRGAEDSEAVLTGFKNMLHLTVGVRDLLGKDDIRATTAALSDVAEVSMAWVAQHEFEQLVTKHGTPMTADQPCAAAVVALGKLGGREPNYHSDHNLLFFFAGEGSTQPGRGVGGQQPISNRHFFARWAQRILKTVNQTGPLGRLYEVAPGFRSAPATGMLATTLDELVGMFEQGKYGAIERQGLCRARVIWGDEVFGQRVNEVVRSIIAQPTWDPATARHLYAARRRMEADASTLNLKRAPGGTLDVEFLVHVHQLRWASQHPEVLERGISDALDCLAGARTLRPEQARQLAESYRFLRGIEARLRLMNAVARHDLPQDSAELRRLSYLLGLARPQQLTDQVKAVMSDTRRLYELLHDPA